MIPKEAITKAIEGGWSNDAMYWVVEEKQRYFELAALDPDFWRALGKALGWREDTFDMWGMWYFNAQEFQKLILTGGDTEAFWRDLLSPKDSLK